MRALSGLNFRGSALDNTDPGWSFNAATGVLQADSLKIPGEVLYRTDRAIAFRVGSQP